MGSGIQLQGQELDTWFTADRAVNSPPVPVTGSLYLFTPLPPADGTPVSIWYDFVDYTPQDAVQHPPNPADYPLPYPAGFEHSFGSPSYLDPVGSVPGLPTLRRMDMNFNPSIEFDGSGDGQALHFRSNSRDEITLFIAFKALGSGNTAETQRLLFGGDIDTHHSSTTNLSVGISSGNRFSVGRTWDGDGGGSFNGGTIDLLGAPTVGTLKREVDLDMMNPDEHFSTWVNGLPDLDFSRIETDAEQDLYLFNRLGKHFNATNFLSDSNLTGNIAEILLVDGPLTATSIQQVESYLAIKYGITLNNTAQLGSLVGNEGYEYLAADGTTIWQVDLTYKYDIAGLGKDRYENSGSLKLRYNLHQVISKSENTEAIVTMATNPDYTSDNFDPTRTPIDPAPPSTSYLHNYLLWGNDHASLNVTNVELPNPNTTVTERISREWRVQKTFSGGVTPISNVSLRVDLSGSDIPLTDSCALYLMIDTDGDGDFTTGPITYINATSVVGTDVFFDNVNFEDQDVFTIGYGDLIPPTASNPATIVVCDTVPAPDPNVVIDEADNCAVATVALINDVSDGLSNPETITRTYRVTDTSGNFIDVTHTIEVYTSPWAGNDNTLQICENDATPLDLFAALEGADSGGKWSDDNFSGVDLSDPTNVNFLSVSPGTYNFTYTVTGTAPCPDDSAIITVTIDEQPVANAGPDIAQCDNSTFLMAANVPAVGNGTWSQVSGPPVAIDDPASPTTGISGPPVGDSATLRWTVTNGACPDSTDDVVITNKPQPTIGVDLSNDPIACGANGNIELLFTNVLDGLYTIDYDGGSFANIAVSSGGATISAPAGIYNNLRITINGCTSMENPDVTLTDPPALDIDPKNDVTACDFYKLPAITGFNLTGNESYFDAPNGAGNQYFSGNNIFATSTLYIYDENGTCFDEESFTVTINPMPIANAGADDEICGAVAYTVTGASASGFDTLLWTHDGNGAFTDASVVNAEYVPDPADIGNVVTLTLTASSSGACLDAVDAMALTIDQQPIADAPDDVESCDSYILPPLTNGNYFDAPNGGGNAYAANDAITTTTTLYVFSPGNGSCPDVENSFTVTINSTPLADAPADVESCDSYILPALTNGSYYTGSNGTGTALFEGSIITSSQTIYVFNSGNGICPDAEESFEVTITGFSVTTNVQHETCWESNNGSVSATISNAVFPVTVQLNNMEPMVFNTDSFSIDDLSPGNYEMSVIDDTGCQTNTNFDIQSGGPNLGGSVDVIYLCDDNLPSNTIAVTLLDPSVSNDVLYALDSSNPNDFTLSPDFGNISNGNHSLFIMHNNGCLAEIPFDVENFEQLELTLTNDYVNQITANVTGGSPPYTYYFDNNSGTNSNTYTIDRSGTFIVRVVDGIGCEVIESISMNLVDIKIPDFFTPNNDWQYDTWAPKNAELFPDIETFIFDRYGRKIQILGPTDEWNGEYESNPMPSGDYWYVVKLNDGSGREFVGHFTLYR